MGTFKCVYCGKNARTVNERNCSSPESPDGRHAKLGETFELHIWPV